MPLYAYKCESCGFAKDVLQKMSAAPLTQCPACGADTFRKQVTAAGFQLKGSGWYVTDFRGGNNAAAPAGDKAGGDGKADAGGSATSGASDKAAAPASAAASPAPSAAPAPAPAPAKSGD